jgi:hypothetical protein
MLTETLLMISTSAFGRVHPPSPGSQIPAKCKALNPSFIDVYSWLVVSLNSSSRLSRQYTKARTGSRASSEAGWLAAKRSMRPFAEFVATRRRSLATSGDTIWDTLARRLSSVRCVVLPRPGVKVWLGIFKGYILLLMWPARSIL